MSISHSAKTLCGISIINRVCKSIRTVKLPRLSRQYHPLRPSTTSNLHSSLSSTSLLFQHKVNSRCNAFYINLSSRCFQTLPQRKSHQEQIDEKAPSTLTNSSKDHEKPFSADSSKESSVRENLYTIPNLLTFSRLVASPFLGYFVTAGQYEAALGLFAFASATDLLDGYIARRYNMQSFVGSIIDPLADKVLMTTLTISLGYVELIPVPLAVLILGRDAGLILASFYYRYISLPPPKTLTRYFDFSLPSAEVHPTLISKINTALQLALMGAALSSPVFEFVGHPVLLWLQGLVGITTVWSGLSYVWSKNAVRILDRKEVLKKLKDRIRKD